MMPPAADPFAASTYTLGALGYFGFAVLLGMRVRGSRRAGLLLGAVVLSTAWALTGAAAGSRPPFSVRPPQAGRREPFRAG